MTPKKAAGNERSETLDHEALLAGIRKAIPEDLSEPERAQARELIRLYYKDAPARELAVVASEDLAGAVLSHWDLARRRDPDTPAIRAINPDFEHHGWQTPNTVVEIVTRDQPWLVSSIRSAIEQAGQTIQLVVHPIVSVQRDDTGRLTSLREPVKGDYADGEFDRESFIHIEVSRVDDKQRERMAILVREVFGMLDVIRRDRPEMHRRLETQATHLGNAEQSAFVKWLDERQFATLGAGRISVTNGSEISDALGILDSSLGELAWSVSDLLPEDAIRLFDGDDELVVLKAGRVSPVIRDEFADLVLVPERDGAGNIVALDCTVGLFIAGLQNEAVNSIPWLSGRVQRVLDASGLNPESHRGKNLASTFRLLPREMLMQASAAELLRMGTGIVGLLRRQQVRLFHTSDRFGRFCHCLVYIPRDAYSRTLRLRIERILLEHIDGGRASYDIRFSSDSKLARLHFVVQKNPPLDRDIDWEAIERRIKQVAVTWNSELHTSLRSQHDEGSATMLQSRYRKAFPASYRERHSAREAAADIDFIETHLVDDTPVMGGYRQTVGESGKTSFRLYSRGHSVPLSDVIPMIENMGLRVESEHPHLVRRNGDNDVWMHEFTVAHADGDDGKACDEHTAERIQDAFGHIWRGEVEDDGFNALMNAANLDWRQIVILRAMCKYLLQVGVPFSQSYMIDTLVSNAGIARHLSRLFDVRFNPAFTGDREASTEATLDAIRVALDDVASLDEDRILKSYRDLILAILRTNAWRRNDDGSLREFVSFKFDSRKVPDLPLPHPMFEIFVYSSRVEGIHLRGGKVARGGLRWSDRREDFRTEILGLMKAQMVKNSVIVPVGSKGGFYVKAKLPAEREAMMAVVVDCYRTFLSGLLDVTDNLVDNRVVPPPDVVRHDEDDPYLVVAADKGTATFSDFANEVAISYGFWLGDAFASGGSAGYDHKGMGITARGAWESVKRHFRNLGVNTQQDEFTVVGIGDMGGDVFGNGMLLSEKIRLVAAFNHLHIFIDPTPDAASTYAERKRLFETPRTTWEDFDASLISPGGGVYRRTEKSITISPEAQTALGIENATMTPTELISNILKAPVDLLWNGGIGTYVKGSTETHADAADRANDGLRINGRDLRVKVMGEGGNLGFTQLGRIEFAEKGGCIYTDAIDNSAGVDCSDHEVNIKILANAVVASDDMTMKQRDQLLESMTDDVSRLVLNDNYLQTQCIDITHEDGVDALTEQSRFMQHLESIGRLNREIEYLPNPEELAERLAGRTGLVKPEIAVLVSYAKMGMYDDLLAAGIAEDPALVEVLHDYFPDALSDNYGEQVLAHRLRPEIITTVVTNEFVNRLGPTFGFRMEQELGAAPAATARAMIATRAIFDLPGIWSAIEALDNQVPSSEQYRMQILVRGLAERSTHWLLRSNWIDRDIGSIVEHFQPGIEELVAAIPDCLSGKEESTLNARIAHFVEVGVPDDTALVVSRVIPLSSSFDIIEIARSLDQPVADAAAVYFELGHRLDMHWLREEIGNVVVSSHWHKLATSELRSDLHFQQRQLTAEILGQTSGSQSADARVEQWLSDNAGAVAKYTALMTELKAASSVDFAMLSLAVNEVHKLQRASQAAVV